MTSGDESMLRHFFYNLIDCIEHDIHTVACAWASARARLLA